MARNRRPSWIKLVDARQNNPFLESEGGRWITWCDIHKQYTQHPRQADAIGWAREPEMWCEGCRVLTHIEANGIATVP